MRPRVTSVQQANSCSSGLSFAWAQQLACSLVAIFGQLPMKSHDRLADEQGTEKRLAAQY